MSTAANPEAIDIRKIFKTYAIVVALAGFAVGSYGQLWLGESLGDQIYGKAALIRVFGFIAMGAACCAAGFASVEDPAGRRRGLLWFAAGHGVVGLMVAAQALAIWGPGIGEWVAQGLLAAAVVLLYLWATAEGNAPVTVLTTLFRAKANSTARLRSRYERQIREAASQEERNRLARDLHDSVKQQIFVIQTAAATAQQRFESDRAGAAEALERVRAAARDAMAEMQAMLDQLHAQPLEIAGLVESIKRQCEALELRSGARVEYRLGSMPRNEDLPPGAPQALFRAAQEALANVGRHARAKHVSVWLGAVGRALVLTVQDDGAGFDPNQGVRGMGLANMKARAEEFDGQFEVLSRPGRGATVRISIPCTVHESARQYGIKAATSAVLAIALIVWSTFDPKVNSIMLAVISLIGTLRYGFAYRRVRALEAGR